MLARHHPNVLLLEFLLTGPRQNKGDTLLVYSVKIDEIAVSGKMYASLDSSPKNLFVLKALCRLNDITCLHKVNC